MSSSVHIDNKEKDILILCIVPTKGIDDTTWTVKVQYSINFSRSNRKVCIIMGATVFVFVTSTRICQFKQKILK